MTITFVVYYAFFTYNRKNIKFYSNQQFSPANKSVNYT